MIWSYVGGNGSHSTTAASLAVTYSGVVAVGKLLLVPVAWNIASTLAIADNAGGNTWGSLGPLNVHGSQWIALFWSVIANVGGVGSSFAVTATPATSGYITMAIDQFSVAAGYSVQAAADSSSTNVSSGSTAAPGTVTPSGTDVVYSCMSPYFNNDTLTPTGTGTYNWNNQTPMAAQYSLDQTSPLNPSFGISSSVTYGAIALALKAVSASLYVPYHQLFRGANLALADL